MDSGEIEEFYDKKIEEADKFYKNTLNDPENDKSKKEVKKKYDEMVKKAIKEYREKYKDFLKKQNKKKKKAKKKQRKKVAEEKLNSKEIKETKPFKVKELDLKLGTMEKVKLKWEMFRFKTKIKIKNIIRKLVSDSMLRTFLKIKSSIARNAGEYKRYVHGKIKNTKRNFSRLFKILGKKFEVFFGLISKTKNKFLKKTGLKKKGKSEDKDKESKGEEDEKEERPDVKKLKEMEKKEQGPEKEDEGE